MAKVILFGAGQWADLARFYLTHDSPHEVVALTVDRGHEQQEGRAGMPVVAFEEVQELYPPDRFKMFVPLGFKKMNHFRADKYRQAKDKGYELVSYVSSKATTWPGFACGDNCFILENSTIQPFAEIGNDVVLWSGCHVGHHSIIKDHVMLASRAVVSGNCTIEPYCLLGANAIVRDKISVARDTLVGAGVVVLNDTKEFELYRASAPGPAKHRSNQIRVM